MENRAYMLEYPFYFTGMSDEDYLYVSSSIGKRKDNILNKVLRGECELPSPKTKKSIFNFLDLDVDYEFKADIMC